KYYLVHTTHSPKGLVTFAEECEKAERNQQLIFQLANVRRKETKTRSVDMFGDLVAADVPPTEPAIDVWLDRLPVSGSAMKVDVDTWAEMLEDGRCLPSALLNGAKELLDRNVIVNECAQGRKRIKHHVNYSKCETVRRT